MKWRLAAALMAAWISPVLAQEPPAKVQGVPYQTWSELDADGFGRSLYFRNDFTRAITITEIVINRCDNTRQSCGTHKVNKVIQPGKTVVAYRIERLIAGRAWSYTSAFRTDFARDATLPPPCTSANGTPCNVLRSIAVDEFQPLVAAETSGGACGAVSVPALPEGHTALMMAFGGAGPDATRRVMVRYNSSGVAYEYSDQRQGSRDAKDAKTIISIDLIRETAIMRNLPAGGQQDSYRVTGSNIMGAESLGTPREMVDRITKECGKP